MKKYFFRFTDSSIFYTDKPVGFNSYGDSNPVSGVYDGVSTGSSDSERVKVNNFIFNTKNLICSWEEDVE